MMLVGSIWQVRGATCAATADIIAALRSVPCECVTV